MTTQDQPPQMQAENNLKITIEDQDTKQSASVVINVFRGDSQTIVREAMRGTLQALHSLGYLEDQMENEKKEQKHDLENVQHPEESDSLQKSVNPDPDFMRSYNLCPRCHGIKHEGPCKVSDQ